MYKAGDLFLKAVIPLWEISSIEVLCGLANIFVQTLPAQKTKRRFDIVYMVPKKK